MIVMKIIIIMIMTSLNGVNNDDYQGVWYLVFVFFAQPPIPAADNIEEQECGPDSWDPVQMQIFCNKYFFQENTILKSFTLLCKPNEEHTSKELNQQSQGIVKDQQECFLSDILSW